jgi:pimeloyl-ACP methyl ester carboxylesterase
MKKVYFLSGLGADKRAFSTLDLSFCEPIFIDWIKPLPHETLGHYATRLRGQMPEEHPVVVGVSFGGMLACEMAKADRLMKVIIIASNKSANEFPYYLRIGKYFPVYKWLPEKLIKSGRGLNWMLGLKDKAHRQLVADIAADMDPAFLKWAIDAILHWQERDVPANVTHIHGTADKLLPLRYVKADYQIQGGTHLISINKPKEISSLLQKLV